MTKPKEESLHERVEHYAALVVAFQSKMRTMGPLTPPEDVALSGLVAAARRAVEEINRLEIEANRLRDDIEDARLQARDDAARMEDGR